MSDTAPLPENIMARVVALLLRVYSEAYEEYSGEYGNDPLEGIVIPDELYNEICEFVEGLAIEMGVKK